MDAREALEARFAEKLAADGLLQDLRALAVELGTDLYLVGGFIRDWMLLRAHPDLDLVTAGDPRELARALARRRGGHVVELDAEFQVERVILRDGDIVDLTALQGADITEDLSRRDLTLNAMAFPLVEGGQPIDQPRLLDPTGGLHDLLTDRIRAVGRGNLAGDPVRLLRAFRFAATLGFTLDDRTQEWAHELASLLPRVAGERLNAELAKILAVPMAGDYLVELAQAGLLEALFPELTLLALIPPDEVHHLDGLHTALETVRRLEKLLAVLPRWLGSLAEPVLAQLNRPASGPHTRLTLLKLGALLHDVGRAATPAPEARPKPRPGSPRPDPDPIGAERVRAIARRLRLSAHDTQELAGLARDSRRPARLLAEGVTAPVPPLLAYRFFRDLGEHAVDVLLLGMADRLAAQGPFVGHEDNLAMEALVLGLLEARFEASEAVFPARLIDGRVLMAETALPPGPVIGELLEALAEAQVQGQVADRDGAIAWARAWLARRRGPDEARA